MINYTDKTVKTNIRLRADLHFAFSRAFLRELDQPTRRRWQVPTETDTSDKNR